MAILLLLLIPILAIIGSFFSGEKIQLLEKIHVSSALLEACVTAYIVWQILSFQSYNFLPYFSLNALNTLILCITVSIGLIGTCHGVGYFANEFEKGTVTKKKIQETYLLMRLFLVLMYIASMTANPIVMWIAVESTTLATVFLVNFFNRTTDIEAAWKFLITNSVGLLFGLLGTLLFLTQAGGAGQLFTQWNDLFTTAHQMNADVVKLAFIFIFIGYGTKMGIVPMHTWLPDAHSQAPSPISSLLSGALINIAFLAILHFVLPTNIVLGPAFSQSLFLFFGLVSIVLAGSIIYTQRSYKRLLAYSTIEHAGLILLGFAFGGIGIFGSLLLMIYHGLGKALFFLLSSNIAVRYSTSLVENVKGMLKTLPFTSVLYIFAFLFMTGMPPFGVFFSEFYIILSGFSHHMIVAIIAAAVLIFVFVGFFRSILAMVFTPPFEHMEQGEKNLWTLIPVGLLAVVLLALSMTIPPFVTQLLHQSVSILTQTQ